MRSVKKALPLAGTVAVVPPVKGETTKVGVGVAVAVAIGVGVAVGVEGNCAKIGEETKIRRVVNVPEIGAILVNKIFLKLILYSQ